jgi:hypothetical protein
MTMSKIREHWMHDEYGEVQVISSGHFPDTVMVRLLGGEYKGKEVETSIADLISDEDSLTTLNALLGNLLASKG